MTAIEILAVIFSAIIILKILIFIINPNLLKISAKLLKKPLFIIPVYLIFAGTVGYYIFKIWNIVGVAAVMLLTSILIGLNFIVFPQVTDGIIKEMSASRKTLLHKAWLPTLIWLGIALWTLYAVFA